MEKLIIEYYVNINRDRRIITFSRRPVQNHNY